VNFADAIRKASREHESGYLALTPVYLASADGTHPTVEKIEVVEHIVHHEVVPAPTVVQEAPKVARPSAKSDSHSSPAGEKTVHLEFTLTTEELSLLFKSVAMAQHSVMTSREAASHLRLPVQRLEEMAKSGEIPAFQVDGKWRFPKAGLDGWVTVQSAHKEAS
jgi:excisionase family DNA binding protein